MTASRFARFFAAGLAAVLATACTSTSDYGIDGGMVGSGGSFEYRGPDGFVWGFAAEGRDLRLQREGAVLVVEGVVPEDGIRYRHGSGLERPDLTFRVDDGPDVVWADARVTLGDEIHRFGAAGSETRIGAEAAVSDESATADGPEDR